jgi:hypothetical protein
MAAMNADRPSHADSTDAAGAPSSPSIADTLPERLGDYHILRQVGRGGMGVVYEAVQESLGRHVALKVLAHNYAQEPTHLERFRREARAAAKLHHTNIVAVYGVGGTRRPAISPTICAAFWNIGRSRRGASRCWSGSADGAAATRPLPRYGWPSWCCWRSMRCRS